MNAKNINTKSTEAVFSFVFVMRWYVVQGSIFCYVSAPDEAFGFGG